MADKAEVHVEPRPLESGAFIQEIILRFGCLERSIAVYTTREAGEAARLSAELEGLLKRLVAAASAPSD